MPNTPMPNTPWSWDELRARGGTIRFLETEPHGDQLQWINIRNTIRPYTTQLDASPTVEETPAPETPAVMQGIQWVVDNDCFEQDYAQIEHITPLISDRLREQLEQVERAYANTFLDSATSVTQEVSSEPTLEWPRVELDSRSTSWWDGRRDDGSLIGPARRGPAVTIYDSVVATEPDVDYNNASEETNGVASMTQKFGVEIECMVPRDVNLYALMNEAGVQNQWTEKHDGSLMPPVGYRGVEIVSVPLHNLDDSFESIKKICNVLNKAGAIINKTCGLHVHVDASGFSAAQMRNVFDRYKKFEIEIDKWMPASRRKSENTYCRSLNGVDVFHSDSINTMCGNTGSSRYLKVNLQAYLVHGTVEFRQHSGTTRADKIINWVKFCINFMKQSKEAVPVVQTQPAGAAEPAQFDELYLSAGQISRMHEPVSDTLRFRIKDFLVELRRAASTAGVYTTLKEVIDGMPVKPSYITRKKYIKTVNSILALHHNAFVGTCVSVGVSPPQVARGAIQINPRDRASSFARDYDTIITVLNQYAGGGSHFFHNIQNRHRALETRLTELNDRVIVTAVQTANDTLFAGIEPSVVSYLRERAEDFGNTVAA